METCSQTSLSTERSHFPTFALVFVRKQHEKIWCVWRYFFSYDLCINRAVQRRILGAPAKDDVWWEGGVLVTFDDVEWCRAGDSFMLREAIVGG